MEILKWQFIDAVSPLVDEVQAERILVVTDCAFIEAEAEGMGAASFRLDKFEDVEAIGAALTRRDINPDVVVVSSRSQPLNGLAEDQWRIDAHRYLGLLRWVFAQNNPMRLLSFYSHNDALSALFDGMARSASLEMPQVSFTSMQITVDKAEIALKERIKQALPWPNVRLQLSGRGLTQRMLVPADYPSTGRSVLKNGDNVIIIGGAGGVGSELCHFLHTTADFRANVFVLGRKTPDHVLAQSLKNNGVKNYFRVDAADYSALDAVFSHICQTVGPIKAVFNLAGALDDGLFYNLTADRLETVLRPKACVVSNLVRLTQDYQPQYVVNFSSLTATIGNIGQSAYAAANEFVERVSDQIPGWYSFSWGLWRSEGMQFTSDASGVRPLAPHDACERMMAALAGGEHHLVIYDGVVKGVDAIRGDKVPSQPFTSEATAKVEPATSIDKAVLIKKTKHWLIEIVRRHSGLKAVHETDNLLNKGLDSIGSIQISTDIEAQLSPQGGFELSRAILFEYPTIAQLSDYLIQQAESMLWGLLQSTVVEPEAMTPSSVDVSVEALALQDEAPIVIASPVASSISPADAYRDDDIAIIGVAGEFPNGATLASFWSSLQNGEDAVTVIPEQRWSWRDDYTAMPSQDGKTYGRHGGFIDSAFEFDPAFFNIAPVDAAMLDPQERRFLQFSYHALEDAGYFIEPTHEVGVFAAAMFGHYQDLKAREGVINSSFASIANRVSYALDLRGPSLTLDTMCSGSLTALHMACNSLRLGECKIALAGGANIMSHPGKYRLLSQGKFLSASGHCHAFGVGADGYVPGEGVATVVLKPVGDAIRNQDKIYAIVRATAINSGGKTSSFTVPSARAQQSVIQAALAQSGVNPADVTYVEAHGTGTSLGDPIELQALQAAYGVGSDSVCYLGSVKSNIGHLESAAAMAGLFKVIQQFAHQQLVPTLHCTIENPYLNIEQTRFQLVRKSQPWFLAETATRFSGLSSFGAGGSNGHAILQQYIPTHVGEKAPSQQAYLIPLSAPNKSSLQRVKQQLIAYLRIHVEVNPYALSYTLCCAKQHHSERECFVVRDVQELLITLTSELAPSNILLPEATIYKEMARQYLHGSSASFDVLFPVKQWIRLPHYPFAKHQYIAPCLAAGCGADIHITEKSAAMDSSETNSVNQEYEEMVLLEPIWRQQESLSSQARPSLIVVMSEAKNIPTHIGMTKVLRISRGDHLQLTSDHICLRFDSEADVAQALKYLMETLGQKRIYWVNLNVHWTSESALLLAKAMHSSQHAYSLLCVNDERQSAENIAMTSVFRILALENKLIDSAQVQIEELLILHSDANWEWVLDELGSIGQEFKEIRKEYHQRWERSLDVLSLVEGTRLRKGGVYLIAGGMGMIGKEIARHLRARYKANVILVGRSPLSRQNQAWLQQAGPESPRESDGQICYMQADIIDLSDTELLVANVLGRFGRLDGVIQSAGILKDAQVQNKSLDDFESVMGVKLKGTRNLDDCTADLALDFFCLFSSMSSIMGNVGQCDYVAANRFLDEFSAQRNEQVKKGLRRGHTLSINWPLWIDDQDPNNSMVQYRALADYLQRLYGFCPLSLMQGSELFSKLVNGVPEGGSQVMGLLGDPDKIMTSLIHFGATEVSTEAEFSSASAVFQEVSIESIQQCLIQITQILTQLAIEDIIIDKSWGDLGINSIMIQTLAETIGKEFNTQVPPNALFTYGNIRHMAEYLVQEGTILSEQAATIQEVAAKVERENSAPSEPVVQVRHENSRQDEERFAIVGMSGVMPSAENIDEFWDLLMQNRSAIRLVDRWQDKSNYAGTIDHIDQFDARFFGLSARESMLMDPQHRLFLQTSYNALMDAGYAPDALTDVGVFAGVQFTDYQTLLQSWGQSSHPYAATGNAHAMLANRVSYLFNFNGPSQTVDTACSSALIAINRGIMSLRNNECNMALVGAVSLLIDPVISDAAKSMGVLSPDSRCATFDESANGYVRAEGVGCVIIKRLADALRDSDSIYGVIETCVENHGGRANSLTAPNPLAQAALLRKAYTTDLASRVSYIETHGTGTKLGDPVEIDALQQAFKVIAPERGIGDIALGAVKTNIGHLEPAAGMASLLKVLLCLKYKVLPANINFNQQNPMINLSGSPFKFLKNNQPWEPGGSRVAGISCFGFGGSNAHMVLSEAPVPRSRALAGRPCWLVTLNARSILSLDAMRENLWLYLQKTSDELADIAFTLACGRELFEYRMSWVVESVADLKEQLSTSENVVVEKCRITGETWTPPLNKRYTDEEWTALMTKLQTCYQQGVAIDWRKLFVGNEYRRLHLPGYVFDTKGYWFEQAVDSAAMKEVNHGR